MIIGHKKNVMANLVLKRFPLQMEENVGLVGHEPKQEPIVKF